MTGEEGTKLGSISNPLSSDGVTVVSGENASSSNGQTSSAIETDFTKNSSGNNNGNSINNKIKDKNCNNIPDRESDSSVECGNLGEGDFKAKNCRSENNIDGKKSDSVNYRLLDAEEVTALSRDRLAEAYSDLARYTDTLKKDNAQLKETEEKLRNSQLDASRRENVLVMRLTTKEHEMQDYIAQLNELKQSATPSPASLRNTLIDPAVNLVIQRMKKELDETKKKLEDTQNDLNAWKFTPDSNTGKRLMAKCRMLYQENEDLGKMITSGKLAKLESEIALQRSLTEEMKKSQSELDELIQELDEDVEGMQGTIYYLQQELRNAKTGSSSTIVSTLNSAQQVSNDNDDVNFKNEIVSLTVKITDLCAQCQVAHQKKQSSQLQALKMEVDDDRTKVDNENQIIINGENSNSSYSDTERLITTYSNPSAVATSSNSDKNDRTTRTPNSNTSDSECRGDDVENRTKGDGDNVSDHDISPPTKRTKLANYQQNKLSTESPIVTNTIEVSGSILSSANQNGSIEH